MDKLLFYEIDNKYIDFLSKFSEHLFHNAKNNSELFKKIHIIDGVFTLKNPAEESDIQYKIYINFEDLQFALLTNETALYNHIKELITDAKKY